MAAAETEAEMNPPPAGLETFLTPVRGGRLDRFYEGKMGALHR
jgi:hypothetical protein